MNDRISELVRLSHELGRDGRQLAILGEGNTSAKLGPKQFAVKASGSCLGTLTEADVTLCNAEPLLGLFERKNVTDAAVDKTLLDSRVDPQSKKPSVEAMFHAWLLTLKDVNFVGHCHPTTVNQVLCSPRARDFAERRMFPDEVVCCGATAVFVPYTDPGLALSREIVERTKVFIEKEGGVPRLILLQNHGLIALGQSTNAVLAATLMADKAAAIFMGAAAMGGPNFLTPQHVERIAGRPDEAYRRQQLKM